MMGLVIIVILVTMGLLFYVSYSADKTIKRGTKGTVRQEYAYNELSTGFIDAFLGSTAPECGNLNMNDLIRDCAVRQRINCVGYVDSCDFINQTLIQIKNETLDVWDVPYGLIVNYSRTFSDNLVFVKHNCTGKSPKGAPGLFPVSLFPHPGAARVELGICKPI